VAVAAGWWLHLTHDPRRANMAAFESDMTEGLLRGIIQELDAGQPKAYFVSFGAAQTDPSRLFMARFGGHNPPVRGLSSSFTLRDGQRVETARARTAVFIQILRCQQFSPETFDVLVLFPKLPDGENRFTYRVFNQSGNWTILRRVPEMRGRLRATPPAFAGTRSPEPQNARRANILHRQPPAA
jgi:hypothetical protein